MPRGWKDYTKPITIEAVTVETLPVDIKAQTIGNIAVDIAAQSLSQLSVNIAASAVTLQVNIASISAGVVFNVAQSGSWTVNAAQTGTWTINIGAPLDVSGNLKTAILSSVQLSVNIAASAVTLQVNIASISAGVVFNVAQSGSWTINAVESGAWTVNAAQTGTWTINIGAPLDASGNLKTAVLSSVQLDVNIAASAVTLNVAIQSSAVTLNVAIQSSAVTLNVDVTNPALKVGQASPALSFDGVDDHVLVPDSSSLHLSGDFTVAVWVKLRRTPPIWDGIADKGRSTPSDWWLLCVSGANKLRAGIGFTDATILEASYPIVNLNEWNLYIFGVEGSSFFTSFNGGAKGYASFTKTRAVGTSQLALGCHNSLTQYVNAEIDEVRIYNRALSADEIADLYNNPHAGSTQGLVLWLPMSEGVGTTVADKSGQGNNGTIYGATWVSREGSVPATVNTNIVAQSIGNIGIDIKAQTLSQLNVNIAASAVTLNVNISSVTSGVTFNVAQSGTWTINAAQSGTWTINIGGPLDASGNVKTAILSSVQLNVNIAASAVTLNVNISSQSVTLNVSVTGTANVNITNAIVNISSVRLMDSGTIKRVWAQISNGTSTMYTVPTGKKFYIYSVALNVLHYGAGSHLGYLTAYDGATNYHILYLSGPDSVDNMHDAIGFNVMSIPAGWSVYVGAGAYSTSIACVIGVEVTA